VYHVEPVFVFSDGRVLACHSTMSSPVAFWARDGTASYNTSRWTNFQLVLDERERMVLYQFLVAQYGKTYNWRGIFCNFLPLLSCCGTGDSENPRTWFCSELFMAALKHVRPHEFAPYRPSRTNVAHLYAILQRHNQFSPEIATISPAASYSLHLN
jgi:hypothetical protein